MKKKKHAVNERLQPLIISDLSTKCGFHQTEQSLPFFGAFISSQSYPLCRFKAVTDKAGFCVPQKSCGFHRRAASHRRAEPDLTKHTFIFVPLLCPDEAVECRALRSSIFDLGCMFSQMSCCAGLVWTVTSTRFDVKGTDSQICNPIRVNGDGGKGPAWPLLFTLFLNLNLKYTLRTLQMDLLEYQSFVVDRGM